MTPKLSGLAQHLYLKVSVSQDSSLALAQGLPGSCSSNVGRGSCHLKDNCMMQKHL